MKEPTMTFNKKLIAGAVGTALSLGLGMQAAQANHDDYVLIPYVVKDTNRTTIVTLIGTGSSVKSGAEMHLQYWTKDTTAANTAACQPNSSELTFTYNDIVTFDTAGLLGAGPLFGDTTNLAPLGTSISYAGPRHGYLVAQWRNLDGNEESGGRGYWIEVDLANGGAHGDVSIGGDGDGDSFNGAADNEVVLDPYDGGTSGWGDGGMAPVAFWPSSLASSVFTVTPLGEAMNTSDNNVVIMQVLNDSAVQGAYDRNENGIDGTVRQTVRCVGRLTAAQLMPGVVANAAWAATGGWGFLTNLGDGNASFDNGDCASGTGDCDAMVYQIDTSTAAGSGKFLQTSTRIAEQID